MFAVFVSIGLATGSVPIERGYLLMALLPTITGLWQLFGFLRTPAERDWGLLTSAAGWFMLALALLVLHLETVRLTNLGNQASQAASPPIFWILLTLSLVLLAIGAILSLTYWRNLRDDSL